VNLDDPGIVKTLASPMVGYVTVKGFATTLGDMAIAKKEPELLEPSRAISTCAPFPWSRPVYEAKKTIFNLVACDNEFEKAFAKFLDGANDVARFSKLPLSFGFSIEYLDDARNLRLYKPDFVAVDADGIHDLIETKGYETAEVKYKDGAATEWCKNASELTTSMWVYRKVAQKEFDGLAPKMFGDLAGL